jgi:hypothetical protein
MPCKAKHIFGIIMEYFFVQIFTVDIDINRISTREYPQYGKEYLQSILTFIFFCFGHKPADL